MKEDNKILASKISKTYGSKENSVHALKETSLSIESGEFAAVRLINSSNNMKKRRFSTAGCAQNSDKLSRFNGK